jgi:hypothetical protein
MHQRQDDEQKHEHVFLVELVKGSFSWGLKRSFSLRGGLVTLESCLAKQGDDRGRREGKIYDQK